MFTNKKKQQEIKRQFGIYYMYSSKFTDIKKASKRGFSTSIEGAIGIAAWHIARDDYYPKAVIVDRYSLKIIRILNRTVEGISIIVKD